MRIITGIAKGRRLLAPEGMDTRPTADRVKESFFNIIADKVYGSIVLDLFAGTGNLGLESISRGAGFCTFIEQNKNAYKILNDNINSLNFREKCECYNQEAIAALKILSKRNKTYDIIFLDPPYGKGLIEKSIAQIDQLKIASLEGIIVAEYDINDMIPEVIGNQRMQRTVKYGRTKVSFFTQEEKNE